jgi:hypothetical protein
VTTKATALMCEYVAPPRTSRLSSQLANSKPGNESRVYQCAKPPRPVSKVYLVLDS